MDILQHSEADLQTDLAPSVNGTDFRQACSKFATGVTVTTVMGWDGMPYGIAVSSFTSVSLDPPLVLVCIDHRSPIVKYLALDRCIGINVLAGDQQDLSERFSRNWAERFQDLEWRPGRTQVPLLPGTLATLEAIIVYIIPAGDHSIFVARALHAGSSSHEPLTYFGRGYRKLAAGA